MTNQKEELAIDDERQQENLLETFKIVSIEVETFPSGLIVWVANK